MGNQIGVAETWFPMLRDAVRNQRRIAGVGWFAGVVVTVLAVVPPVHQILLATGLILLTAMLIHTVRSVREGRVCQRIARLPALTNLDRTQHHQPPQP